MQFSTSYELTTSADIAFISDAPRTATERAIVTCIGIAGILGNGLVLRVLLSDKVIRKKICNLLVINQSLVDFVTCVVFIMTYISKGIPKSYEGAGIWLCWLVDLETPMYILLTVSTTNLMAITIERYLMIVFPVIHRTHITFIFVLCTIAFIWAFTTIQVCAVVYPFSGISEGVCYLQAFFPHEALAWFISVYSNVAYFVTPVVMILVCYPLMMRVSKRRMKVQPGNTSNLKISKQQLNLTQVMLLVSVAFVVCWAPINIHYLLKFTGILPDLNFHDMLYRILVGLSLVNSCVNPFIYAYNYADFKKGFRQIFLKTATEPTQSRTTDTLWTPRKH